MELSDYLEDVDRGLSFALWLYRRQTYVERQQGQTLDKNKAGFNQPDAKRFAQSLKALDMGIKFPRLDIIRWYRNDVEHRLLKYKKQFKVYMNEDPHGDIGNHRNFERRHPMV